MLRKHRELVIEELYDLKADPHSVNNLINNPEYKEKINEYRAKLVNWMTEHSDPVLALYQVKEQPQKMISMLKSEFPSRAELMPEQQRIEQEKLNQQRNRNKKNKK